MPSTCFSYEKVDTMPRKPDRETEFIEHGAGGWGAGCGLRGGGGSAGAGGWVGNGAGNESRAFPQQKLPYAMR